MSALTVRLSFSAPVHFGRGRLSDAAYTCDAGTLFSALFIEALGCGEEEGLLEAARSGDLLLSDAFPYIGGTLYLPKPMVVRDALESGDRVADTLARKAAKKLAYIPCDAYEEFLEGTMDVVEALECFNRGLGKSYLQTKVDLTRLESEDARPYHVGGYRFLPGSGIYFIARGSYDILPLLERLQYAGIGGERSSGYGRFSYRAEDGDPSEGVVPSRSLGLHVLLSTVTPTRAELDDSLLESARYRLVRRGGFVLSATHHASPQKKRDLYLFSSGSVFPKPFQGGVYDVNATPEAHPVWRYARAMWMGV